MLFFKWRLERFFKRATCSSSLTINMAVALAVPLTLLMPPVGPIMVESSSARQRHELPPAKCSLRCSATNRRRGMQKHVKLAGHHANKALKIGDGLHIRCSSTPCCHGGL